MDIIARVIDAGFVWDDSYSDFGITQAECKTDRDLIGRFIGGVWTGMRDKKIDSRFYDMAQKVAIAIRPCVNAHSMQAMHFMMIDSFLPYEEVKKYFVGEQTLKMMGVNVESALEYFMLTRLILAHPA